MTDKKEDKPANAPPTQGEVDEAKARMDGDGRNDDGRNQPEDFVVPEDRVEQLQEAQRLDTEEPDEKLRNHVASFLTQLGSEMGFVAGTATLKEREGDELFTVSAIRTVETRDAGAMSVTGAAARAGSTFSQETFHGEGGERISGGTQVDASSADHEPPRPQGLEHGSQDAALSGLQSDASGHFESTKSVNSSASGVRV